MGKLAKVGNNYQKMPKLDKVWQKCGKSCQKLSKVSECCQKLPNVKAKDAKWCPNWSKDASASKKSLQNLTLRGCSSFHRLCEDYQNWIVGGDPNLIWCQKEKEKNNAFPHFSVKYWFRVNFDLCTFLLFLCNFPPTSIV